jgi:hypothetical protein
MLTLEIPPFTTSPQLPHHFFTPSAYISFRKGSRVAGHYAGDIPGDFTWITDALSNRRIR